MKTSLFFLLTIFLLAACDAPQRTRAPMNFISSDNVSNPGPGFSGTTSGSQSGGSTGTTTGGGTTTTDPGFQHCDLSDKYHTIDIGHFGLCQSTLDESIFRFRTSMASSTVRICLIPTYKDANGSSTYLGQPQCAYTVANKVIQGQLYKNRNGFSDKLINGVIVMKEPLLNSYFGCMNAFINWPANACPQGVNTSYNCSVWLRSCPYGASANASCAQVANAYMAQVCNSFKTTYGNSYVDIRTR